MITTTQTYSNSLNGDVTVRVVLPTVNLNGSTASDLLSQQNDVLIAIRGLVTALQAAAPHGRDFQLNRSDEEYNTARTDHYREMDFMNEIGARHSDLSIHFADEHIARTKSQGASTILTNME